MKLNTAYARFYKAFNFDQIRKLAATERQPWEMFRDVHYPYVTVPIDPKITTVVGANESGKSQLLTAIKKAITGQGMEHRDLCRYAPFFTVAQGQSCWPHVGVGWDQLTADEAAEIAAIVDSKDPSFRRFLMFREQPDMLTVWLPTPDGPWTAYELKPSQRDALTAFLPKPFEIKADVALPNSIPFTFLTQGDAVPAAELTRETARRLIEAAPQLQSLLGGNATHLQQHAAPLFDLLQPLIQPAQSERDKDQLASLELGRRLLIELGEVDPNGLNELAKAIDQGHDGYAGGLLRSLNAQLERQLNFKRYWVQDRDFSLRVATRDRELVFTISDRTGTEYTFSERSSGLRYFLSYLIQAQVHRPTDQRESILLMDEPDTYLSAEAQQDLMRLFADLAEPNSVADPIQVVYVTHSPFLLDKNHSERIRVLEKGTNHDGTRVVPNVSRNHYEPLRSAFGAFVGETAFVGAVNLLVEGAADQITLAGASAEIRRRSPDIIDDSLDLNRMVIVPCGSAGEVPHTLYRVRGQGADKPPVVVLLDSDNAGKDAARSLKTDKLLKRNISADLVLDLAAIGADVEGWPATAGEIEDLVPPVLAHAAVEAVVEEITKFREGARPKFTLAAIRKAISEGGATLDAINKVVAESKGKIEKIAFAKAVADICQRPASASLAGDITTYLDRMRHIFRAVNRAMRHAEREARIRQIDTVVDQRTRLFLLDHPYQMTREEAGIVLTEITAQLDSSVEADAIRNRVLSLRRDHKLDEEIDQAVLDPVAFRDELSGLKHAYRVVSAGYQNHVGVPAQAAQ